MTTTRRPGFVLATAASIVLVVSACGGDGKAATTPQAAEVDTAAATATTQPPSDPESGATTTIVAGGATDSTTPPTTTTATTIVVAELPRTTAPATEEEPVPPGEVIEVSGIWDIVVTDVRLDATAEVLAFADINPSPEPGFQYVMVALAGTYLGERTAQPAFEWAISDGQDVFEPWIPGCGVVPDSIYDIVDVTPNESFIANLCLPVPATSVAAGLTLYLQPQGGDPFYFELDAGS